MSNGSKQTFEAIEYGNREGKIAFGTLNLSGQGGLGADVLTGVELQACHSLHYLHMENSGPREGWTLQRNPGVWEVKCADTVKEGEIGGYIEVQNGDLVLKAPNGRIRLQAADIDLRADGYDSKTGVINIDSNNQVRIKTGKFTVTSENGIGLFSPQAIDLVSNTAMNLTSNFVGGITSAAAGLAGKAFPQATQIFNDVSRYTLGG